MVKICIAIFALALICFSQQPGVLKQGSLTDGEDIIRKAREAAGFSLPMTSFRLKLHGSLQISAGQTPTAQIKGNDLIIDSQDEITVMTPDKIRRVSTLKDNILQGSNATTSIWNENKYRQTTEFEINGVRTVKDTTATVSIDSLNQLANKADLKKINVKPIDSKIIFSNGLWKVAFPFLLMHPIERQTKFEYMGRAQAGEQIANLVQTNSAGGHVFQLFFDEKTSNLLLMIEKWKESDRDYEVKYYFSNREKRGDVLIPTKVKIEHKVTSAGQSPKIAFEYIDVVGFEVNPVIKPEIFKVN